MNHTRGKEKYKPLIFIAEDSPESLKALYQFLKTEEYRISAVGNGRQALEMIPNLLPDLVLLDIMMPEPDGFTVCEQLQNNPVTKDIPIIFLTARTEKADIVKGFELGAVDYITKPFNGAELLARINTHLELKFSRESLKELNATKDKFFSIIAHDLKNPLQGLLSSAEVLNSYYDSFNEVKKKELIRRFYDSSQQFSALLKNLLTWSMSQQGKINLNPQKIDIADIIEENLDLIKESAGKKNITLSSQIERNAFVWADKNMLRTVLRNLLSNAVKFTNPGGEVRVQIHILENHARILVSDNGVGIPPQDIPNLFRVDVHISTRGTAGEKGTGLGLILCKEFVEKNNGTIDVESVPGEGTTFTTLLPLYRLISHSTEHGG